MTIPDTKAKGPGQRGQGNREGTGFSFGDDRGGGGGRDGGRGGRDGGRGGRGDRKDGGGASFRVVNELSSLEKPLTKADFVAMKAPLGEVLKAIKPLRLQSLENLDLNTRGKLITSMMRVMRLPKPKAEELPAAEAAPAPEAAPAEAAAPAEGAPAAEAAPAAAPAAPAMDPRVAAWHDAQFTVGLIWASVNAKDRADAAFESAGRQPTAADLAVPAAPPRVERPERSAGPRGDRKDRGPREGGRGERPSRDRTDRPARPPRSDQRPVLFVPTGDWQADAKKLEEMGRTRDAGRTYEKNKAYADAARLYEVGGDLKSALRNAALGKLDELIAKYQAKLKPEEVIEALERAEAWEKLMELHVGRQDFDAIAKLYERAGQFDQAALAWERSGKYALARKAYERAKDYAGANRVRDLEIHKLIERGDRLGAATVLMTVGKKTEALETLKGLPGPKAFHFMQKLKLNEEATLFAKAELAKSEAENNQLQRARWLELLGDFKLAAETYLGLNRKDKAALVYADMGDFKQAATLMEAAGQLDKATEFFTKAGDSENAARVKALPRPEPKKDTEAKAEVAAAGDAATSEGMTPPPVAAPEPKPSASA